MHSKAEGGGIRRETTAPPTNSAGLLLLLPASSLVGQAQEEVPHGKPLRRNWTHGADEESYSCFPGGSPCAESGSECPCVLAPGCSPSHQGTAASWGKPASMQQQVLCELMTSGWLPQHQGFSNHLLQYQEERDLRSPFQNMACGWRNQEEIGQSLLTGGLQDG